ncbi:MAG: TonB-dependent receptor plug domain-containing protein, partial [Xanthomonadales bacterium]|nr:TonB-dependent receptor plug domain-containing protein [Xanthomonadales bacterium]
MGTLLWPGCTLADESYRGRPVQEVLEIVRADGAPLLYSTNLVTPELLVEGEPRATQPLDIAREILAPHGLALSYRDGVYAVVRAPGPESSEAREDADQDPQPGGANQSGPAQLEIVTVSASRYVLQSASQFFIDQRAIQALPDLGEDPIRSAQRLPGTAASGLSSRSHFRGGTHDETVIYLNGLQLLDPFHIRAYHSIFSTIDARAISGMEAYTGGFPAEYGDRTSGVLALESQSPDEPRHTELGLSVYNTSFLHSGFSAGDAWDWLVSARESNLDIILNPDL